VTRLTWPAAERNREPILDALRPHLPPSGLVVEVGSGTGQHVAWFAEALPALAFQPTDWIDERFDSVRAWCRPHPNVRPPLVLDAAAPAWPIEAADVVYSANVVHISPVRVLHGLLEGAGRILADGGLLALYGPYLVDGEPTTESNAAFDRSLKERDPAWGLRDRDEVTARAAAAGLAPLDALDMPANNFLLLFRRTR
jgi:SAM-dependent methyltransferase